MMHLISYKSNVFITFMYIITKMRN